MAQGRTRQRTRQQGFGPSTQAGVDAPLSVGQIADAATVNPIQLLQGLVSLISQGQIPQAQTPTRARRGVQQPQIESRLDQPQSQSGSFAQSQPQDPRSIGADIVRKVAEKRIKETATQALDSGIAPEKLLDAAMGSRQPIEQKPQMQPQQQIQPQQQQLNPVANLLRNILTLGGAVQAPGADVRSAQADLLRQQSEQIRFAREEGLTAAEQQNLISGFEKEQFKLIQSRANDFLKAKRTPLATGKDLSLVESSLNAIDNVIDILGISADEQGNVNIANKSLLSNKNFLNKNRQNLIRARNAYINKALRRDTGAAIGKDEEKQFRETYGFDVGLKAFFQNPDVIAKAILESKDQFIRDRQRLNPSGRINSIHDQLIARGYSPQEAAQAMAEEGLI